LELLKAIVQSCSIVSFTLCFCFLESVIYDCSGTSLSSSFMMLLIK
jgi:hypothetical protein